LERSNGAPASASGSDVLPTASELLSLYQGRPRALKEGSRAFFDAQELKSFAARAGATGEFRRMISPPLELSAAAASGVVNLVWISNPRNDALRQKITNDPLLDIGYQIYRWTKTSRPQVLANTKLEETAYVDASVGPGEQEYFYAVVTVLQGRVANSPTVIESERSNVVRVDIGESFELEVLRRVEDGVLVAVRVADPEQVLRHEFLVRRGEKIGTVEELGPGRSQSFETGLTLTDVQETEEEKEVDVERALFEPDGRRTLDATGRPAFESVKKSVRSRRLKIEASTASGVIRIFYGQPVPVGS
jgi:hypothetical protein